MKPTNVDTELRKLSIALGEAPLAFCVVSAYRCEVRERLETDERWGLVAYGATAREALAAAQHACSERIEERGREFRHGRAAALDHNRAAAKRQIDERMARKASA